MKMSVSTVTLFSLTLVGVAALSVEGAKSYASKFSMDDRVTLLEESVSELITNQRYLFELIASQPVVPAAGTPAIRIEQTSKTVTHEDLDVFCLAKNIFHEASIEDELGMFAVAQVTINRVRNPDYPNKICDVVMQPAQFSWTNDKSRRWSHPTGPKWEMAKRIARQVTKEGYRVPALQSAMFYHADYTKPSWRNPDAVVAQVGTHIFYTAAR